MSDYIIQDDWVIVLNLLNNFVLPNGFTKVKFDNDFDQPIDFLPNGITHLTLGKNFNKAIILPATMAIL